MFERFLKWLSGMKIPVGVYIITLFLVFSLIAVSCQGLFNVNANESAVILNDTLKGGSNET